MSQAAQCGATLQKNKQTNKHTNKQAKNEQTSQTKTKAA